MSGSAAAALPSKAADVSCSIVRGSGCALRGFNVRAGATAEGQVRGLEDPHPDTQGHSALPRTGGSFISSRAA
jgi:hypothetical protein